MDQRTLRAAIQAGDALNRVGVAPGQDASEADTFSPQRVHDGAARQQRAWAELRPGTGEQTMRSFADTRLEAREEGHRIEAAQQEGYARGYAEAQAAAQGDDEGTWRAGYRAGEQEGQQIGAQAFAGQPYGQEDRYWSEEMHFDAWCEQRYGGRALESDPRQPEIAAPERAMEHEQ